MRVNTTFCQDYEGQNKIRSIVFGEIKEYLIGH